jgi:hypothetical protein
MAQRDSVLVIMVLDSLRNGSVQKKSKSKPAGYLLDPILVIALAGGPIKVMHSLCSCSAKLAFSLRKPYLEGGPGVITTLWKVNEPYPGWTAYRRNRYIHYDQLRRQPGANQSTYLRTTTVANLDDFVHP